MEGGGGRDDEREREKEVKGDRLSHSRGQDTGNTVKDRKAGSDYNT